ncbi:MAG: glycerol-3-phosphate dehydrogenase [Opitutae bacterium]|nr:glycerol-3-phosphate dehydrogenase [Opitutae bacterium]
MNLCILGAGAWGTAMAIYLTKRGHVVTLCPRRMDHALELSSERKNLDYLPQVEFPSDLQIGREVGPALMEADYVFFACPSHALRTTSETAAVHLSTSPRLKGALALCKGLEPKTNKYAHEVMSEALGDVKCGYLTGPSHALELAEGKPAAMCLAINSPEDQTKVLQEAISSSTLRIYRSEDQIGAAIGGTLKNVYAIAVGISDGLCLGDNARAALITRCLNEMIELGVHLGGKKDTFIGLSGVGDLIATCAGEWSRNRTFGQAIASGKTASEIIEAQNTVVEGYWATECFYEKSAKSGATAPVLDQVHRILYQGSDPRAAVIELMARDLKAEG